MEHFIFHSQTEHISNNIQFVRLFYGFFMAFPAELQGIEMRHEGTISLPLGFDDAHRIEIPDISSEQ